MQRGAIIAVWVVLILLWRNHQTSNDLSTAEAGQRFIDAADAAWWGLAAYIGVYLLRPLVLFPASLLTIAAGVLFGPVVGVIAVVIGANGSALVAYTIGRLLRSRGATTDGMPAAALDTGSLRARWEEQLRTRSFETVFVMRLLFLPFDVVNVASGALAIRVAPFVLATALGSLPGTISFVLLGASLDRIDEGLGGINPWAIVASVVIFVASLAIARAIRAGRFGDRFADSTSRTS